MVQTAFKCQPRKMVREGRTASHMVQLHNPTIRPRHSSITFLVKSRTGRRSEHSQEVEVGEAKSSRRIMRPLDREALTVAASEEEEEDTEAEEDRMVDKTEASRGEASGMAQDSEAKAAMVRSWGSHSRTWLFSQGVYDTERAV